MTYETINTWPVVTALFVAFWLAVVAIGYCALMINDNHGVVGGLFA